MGQAVPPRASSLTRRLIAARYRAADSLRSVWRSDRMRLRLIAAWVAVVVAIAVEASGLAGLVDAEARALVAPLDPSSLDVGATVVSIDTPDDLAGRARLLARLREAGARAVVVVPSLGDPPRGLGLRADGERVGRLVCEGAMRDGLRRLALPCEDDTLLRFAPPSDPTTRIPAAAVLRGDVPASTFDGAIVVVGETGGPVRVSTSRGELSAPDAVAQALGALAVGRGAHELRGPPMILLAGLLVAGTITLVRTPQRRAARALLLASAVLGVSLGLALAIGIFAGPTTPLAAMVTATLALATLEARSIAARLGALVARLEGVGARAVDPGRFAAIARLAETELDALGSVVFELPEGRWHVRVAAADGFGERDLVETRRDVRRDPFTEAVRAGYVAVPRLLADAPHTVLVPLVAEGVTLGFWAVAFRQAGVDVGPLAHLAAELAAGLLHAEAEVAATFAERGFVALADRLAHLDAASTGLASRVLRDERTLEALPVPVLVAGPWGSVEVVNFAMRELLAKVGVDPDERGLARVLASAGALHEVEAQALVARAMGGGVAPLPISVEGRPGTRLELLWAPGLGSAPGSFTLTATSLDPDALAARDAAFSRAEPSVTRPLLRLSDAPPSRRMRSSIPPNLRPRERPGDPPT